MGLDSADNTSRRRSADDSEYLDLGAFKADLRRAIEAGRPDERLPKIRSISVAVGGGSTSTISNALNPSEGTVPSRDTVAKLAATYDPQWVQYWGDRREKIAARSRRAATATAGATATNGPALPAEPGPASTEAVDQTRPDLQRARNRRLTIGLTTVLALGVIAVAAAFASRAGDDRVTPGSGVDDPAAGTPRRSTGSSPGEPDGSGAGREATEVPADYSDPEAAGCVEAGSERLRSEVVPSVGLVSLVYSAGCDAYWARAERTDGKAIGNYIDLSLSARGGSAREPSVATDPDSAIIYTYLLTGDGASAFCVDATFFAGDRAVTAPRFCVPRQ